jgi:pimeloyl-ACP methyl ester carboxylesterase
VGDHRGDDLADRTQATIDDGDRRGAMAMFLEEAGGVPERVPGRLRDAVFALDDHLTDSHVVELDGRGHMATETAPETVAAHVREFVAPERTRK